jgi:hypothetical protein
MDVRVFLRGLEFEDILDCFDRESRFFVVDF